MTQWWQWCLLGEFILCILFLLLGIYVSGKRHQYPLYFFQIMFGIMIPFSILCAGTMFFVVLPMLDQTYSHLYLLLVGLCDIVIVVGWQFGTVELEARTTITKQGGAVIQPHGDVSTQRRAQDGVIAARPEAERTMRRRQPVARRSQPGDRGNMLVHQTPVPARARDSSPGWSPGWHLRARSRRVP